MQNILLQHKIQVLEQEVKELKQSQKVIKSKKKKESLYGILKGIKSSWKDFQEAKKIWNHSESHIK